MTMLDRSLIVLGGIAGLTGVALAAMAAHVTGGGNLQTASQFLLVHAPAVLAAAILAGSGLVHGPIARAAGFAFVAGLILFCGDLSLRALYAVAPLPMAAPTGGMILMAGWLALAVAGLFGRR
ncbi:DUF423 domain-containing protein [Enterovirga rhinocerotis]|uniref:Uncharacterized membrane protein YgdD (TMEM256/DUF423 family) n=1 Tax=Enterovirga rhinocerotis TaxID=1339210 RepID=A0A4R7C4G2_9HYPH|nr:DUF423 domain-containing protein [Enterovirga rhinocerotis]TDR93384.1 uncharacterized membrane protein YgdD (TMEM256/DUF423 family) [Enterovirga rhinocerotis]